MKETSAKSIGKTERVRYRVLSPEKGKLGAIEVSPNEKAVSSEVFPALALMLCHASGRSELPRGEMNLLYLALDMNNITADEVMKSFWKAYGDPFVSQGKIEFRHLWKHIEKMRFGRSGKTYTFEEMLMCMGRENIPQSAFQMVEERDAQGRKKWSLK